MRHRPGHRGADYLLGTLPVVQVPSVAAPLSPFRLLELPCLDGNYHLFETPSNGGPVAPTPPCGGAVRADTSSHTQTVPPP